MSRDPDPPSPKQQDQPSTASEAATTTDRMLRLVMDNIPQGVFWKDRQSQYLGCNQVVAHAFGLDSPEAIVGMDDYRLPGLTREQADHFVAHDRAVMERNQPEYGIIEQATLEDGSTIWIETNKMPLHDTTGAVIGILGTWQNITARKRAEDELRESEDRFRQLIDHAPEAVVILDSATGRFFQTNPAAERLFKLTAEELRAVGPMEMSPEYQPDGRPSSEGGAEFITRALAGETPVFEWTHRDSEGRELPCEVRLLGLEIGGRAVIRGSVTDISERKRSEEERLKLEAQIRHAQKLESLGVLAGGIAHDFNNLLTGILGYSDLALLELPPHSPARPLIAEAVNGARKAADLTKQMLAYSGKGKFVVESLDLNDVIEDMAHLLQVSITKKCVLKLHLMPGLPTIEADAVQMRQIIMNLILNASDAIGDRSGAISVTTGVMRCDQAYLAEVYLDEDLPEGHYVYLEVADSGSGMSEETRARIFDPFFTTKDMGRGLGLAAVLGIVRGHRGAIKVYSEAGRGSTFKVAFPARDLPASSGESVGSPEAAWHGSGTVLIVDDEEAVRGIARIMLERMGFAVLTANDGREGVEVYRRHWNDIRLVLLDMTMPHLDGAETFRELRRIRADVKAILSSGYNEQSAGSQFAGKGLAGFIQKPYRYEDLLAVIRNVIEI